MCIDDIILPYQLLLKVPQKLNYTRLCLCTFTTKIDCFKIQTHPLHYCIIKVVHLVILFKHAKKSDVTFTHTWEEGLWKHVLLLLKNYTPIKLKFENSGVKIGGKKS